jgi:hypothetical protein
LVDPGRFSEVKHLRIVLVRVVIGKQGDFGLVALAAVPNFPVV